VLFVVPPGALLFIIRLTRDPAVLNGSEVRGDL
jgi:hypothetical protein